MTDYQQLADIYFNEYKTNFSLIFIRDAFIWKLGNFIIKYLPLQVKSMFSDYVINKICTHSDEVLLQCYQSCLDEESKGITEMNVCTIGNLARLIIELHKRNLNTEADKLTQLYYPYMNYKVLT